ncbi:MAG: hypothetical protein AAFQ85_02150 [Pseudomonadota bacterium]
MRIYDQKPILIVAGANVTVETVPNLDKAYAVRFGTFLAKHDLILDIEKGALAQLTSNQDSTALPIALVNLVTEAVKSGNPLGDVFSGSVAPQGQGVDFGVFDIVFDGEGNIEKLVPLLDADRLMSVSSGTASGGGAPSGPPGGTSTPPTQ